MTGEQLDAFVAAVRATPDLTLDEAREQELRRELVDLTLDEALAALRAWRLLHPDRTRVAAGALRAVWAEADLEAPSPRDASNRIAAVFRRERAIHDASPDKHVAGTHPNRTAIEELRRRSRLLWRVTAEYGGPPPERPDRWRDEWLPAYDRVVHRELRARILRVMALETMAAEREAAMVEAGASEGADATAAVTPPGDDEPAPQIEIRVSRRLQPDHE